MVLIFAAIIAVTLFGATEDSTPSIENLELESLRSLAYTE